MRLANERMDDYLQRLAVKRKPAQVKSGAQLGVRALDVKDVALGG